MVDVEHLRESRSSAPVKFKEFTTLFSEFGTNTTYFMFEGEDAKYYGGRIETIARPKARECLSCGGKEEVKRLYNIIKSQKKIYGSAKIAYFIDKDFDDSIYASEEYIGIYETPCYSIENFYTSLQAFQKILEGVFGLIKTDVDFIKCSQIFQNRQQEFHREVSLLNAWAVYQRQRGKRAPLNNFNLSKFIHISLDKVSSSYNLETFKSIYPHLENPSEDEIEKIIKEFESYHLQSFFRGKFEILFLCSVVSRFIEDSNRNEPKYFSRKKHIGLNLNEGNIILTFCNYADTPDCLTKYLESFRENVETKDKTMESGKKIWETIKSIKKIFGF